VQIIFIYLFIFIGDQFSL